MTTNEIKGRTIVLPEESDSIVDKICNIAGWGQTENRLQSSVLKEAQTKQPSDHESIDECKDAITKNAFCARGDAVAQTSFRSGTCNGDSGGPLFCEKEIEGKPELVQYGVVSYGARDCGSLDDYDFFADVRLQLDWIKKHTSKALPIERNCAPATWTDTIGFTCALYKQYKWCRKSGALGQGWNMAWGDLSRFEKDGYDGYSCAECGCN